MGERLRGLRMSKFSIKFAKLAKRGLHHRMTCLEEDLANGIAQLTLIRRILVSKS